MDPDDTITVLVYLIDEYPDLVTSIPGRRPAVNIVTALWLAGNLVIEDEFYFVQLLNAFLKGLTNGKQRPDPD